MYFALQNGNTTRVYSLETRTSLFTLNSERTPVAITVANDRFVVLYEGGVVSVLSKAGKIEDTWYSTISTANAVSWNTQVLAISNGKQIELRKTAMEDHIVVANSRGKRGKYYFFFYICLTFLRRNCVCPLENKSYGNSLY